MPFPGADLARKPGSNLKNIKLREEEGLESGDRPSSIMSSEH